MLSRIILDPPGGNGGPEGGRRSAEAGGAGHAAGARRDAGVYLVPFRVDLWRRRGDCVFPRYDYHDRNVRPVQQGNLADGNRGPVDAGRLLDERHHRDLRSDPREFEDLPPRVARVADQQERESNPEPNHPDLGFNLYDGDGSVSVRRTSTERIFFRSGDWYSDRDVFVGFRCQPNCAILAQFRGSAKTEVFSRACWGRDSDQTG